MKYHVVHIGPGNSLSIVSTHVLLTCDMCGNQAGKYQRDGWPVV